MERIMIIIWRWNKFKSSGRIITNEFCLAIPDMKSAVIKGENIFWDEFTLWKNSTHGLMQERPTSKIVRAHVKNESDTCLSFIKELVDFHHNSQTEIFLFLHRGDTFSQDAVTHFLTYSKAAKCFLIGGERDLIYWNYMNIGLLDDDGNFFLVVKDQIRPR